MKKLLKLQLLNLLAVLSQRFLERSVVTVYCRHYTLQDKMQSMLSVSLPSTSGRPSCITPLALVSKVVVFIVRGW